MPVFGAMRKLGVYSYTIYLTQGILFIMLPKDLVRSALMTWIQTEPIVDVMMLLAFVTVGIGAGVLLSTLVEKPVLKWRESRYPAKRDASQGEAFKKGTGIIYLSDRPATHALP
jgi:peptidoglycan/LPS O-acetylase OafA/YrhL